MPHAFTLHSAKWVLREKKLIQTFNNEYGTDAKKTWLRCIARVLVNHQCGLENYNKQVKRFLTKHKHLAWHALLPALMKFVEEESMCQKIMPWPDKPWEMPPTGHPACQRVTNLWTRACAYVDVFKQRTVVKTADGLQLYLLNATWTGIEKKFWPVLKIWYECDQPMPAEVSNPTQGFNIYMKRRTSMYKISVNQRSPFDTLCTCPYAMSYQTCKHALASAIIGGAKIPEGCDFRSAVQQRRRGRPKQNVPFLEKEKPQAVKPLAPVGLAAGMDADVEELSLSCAEQCIALQMSDAVGQVCPSPPLSQDDAFSQLSMPSTQ